jgi:hypothetical protein
MIQISYEQAEIINQKLLIMQAAVLALCDRMEEYNPEDEVAAGAQYSVLALRDELKSISP